MIFWEEEIVDHICYITGTTRDVAHAMVMSKGFIFIQGWSMGESPLNMANRILKEYQIEEDRKSKTIV